MYLILVASLPDVDICHNTSYCALLELASCQLEADQIKPTRYMLQPETIGTGTKSCNHVWKKRGKKKDPVWAMDLDAVQPLQRAGSGKGSGVQAQAAQHEQLVSAGIIHQP